ncbi:MAG TPA: FliA/WhiG family RNA polymerase sigma factor [Firmicutes bacterium]|nr:FliA/WhiG family RNA polymerase sigma factor [Bacillota bacterium]
MEELWQKYIQSRDTELRDALIREHLPLVKKIAGRLSIGLPSHVEEEELVASGVVGLLEALERYDPSYEAGFKTFATWRIRGAMLDELRRITWMPRSIYKRWRRLQDMEQKMSNRLGREPSLEELADELQWSPEEVAQIYNHMNCCSLVSLESLLFDPSFSAEQPEKALSGSGPFITPEESLEKSERREALSKAIEGLSEREKLILALYYKEELTLKEIGQVIKVSTARVSQIHARSLLNLRKKLQGEGYQS